MIGFPAKKTNMSKYEVVMIRHGESEWNQANLFCGWFDSDLSDAGRAEAEAAGKALKGNKILTVPNNNKCKLLDLQVI